MAEKRVFQNVAVVDNGLRCFVPPCFMYNIVDNDGIVAITVSQIKIDNALGRDEKDIIRSVLEGGMRSSGVVSEYFEYVGREEKIGLRFTITQIQE